MCDTTGLDRKNTITGTKTIPVNEAVGMVIAHKKLKNGTVLFSLFSWPPSLFYHCFYIIFFRYSIYKLITSINYLK
jgi:hypothetical protein